ncbi:hypothetical protein [Lentzea sp. CC55]|uniref:hypothetical protein n=1 Tax=Lentzea sp. CC55 TaxID=2884909 RepID=UPI001F257FF7|nr:hypothetical protein [Lentzea sp. CC55]MCG8921085.1 hypothetical protein [Lentzea sp. CC55]
MSALTRWEALPAVAAGAEARRITSSWTARRGRCSRSTGEYAQDSPEVPAEVDGHGTVRAGRRFVIDTGS